MARILLAMEQGERRADAKAGALGTLVFGRAKTRADGPGGPAPAASQPRAARRAGSSSSAGPSNTLTRARRMADWRAAPVIFAPMRSVT